MTDFSIAFPESALGEVSPVYIDSFSFVTDIYKTFAGAKVVFKNFCREAFNEIKVGQAVDFTLKTANTKEAKEYINHMRVLSFEKIPGPQTELVDLLSVTLISSWYFVSAIQTKAYLGSVGEIVGSVFSQNFNEEDVQTDFSPTTDPARLRYQISEKSQDFLKRILKYGSLQKTPIYLYTDARNTVNLKSLNDFFNNNISAVLIPDLVEASEASTKENIEELRTSNKVRLTNYKFLADNFSSSARHSTFFTVDSFVDTGDVKGSVTMANAENNNSASDTSTPNVAEFMDWSYTPQDAAAIATRKYYEDNLNAFSLAVTVDGFALDTLPLGSLNKVVLPLKGVKSYSGREESLGEGGYVVQHLEYTFTNNMSRTKAILFLAKYN